jgi:hypothetical protein
MILIFLYALIIYYLLLFIQNIHVYGKVSLNSKYSSGFNRHSRILQKKLHVLGQENLILRKRAEDTIGSGPVNF